MHDDTRARSVPAMALSSGLRFGDAVAVIDGDRSLTFAEVADEMMAVAKALVARGVEPGDRVAVWAPNSIPWISAALGILAAGAQMVPLNTRFKGTEAAFVLEKASVRTVMCANGFLGTDYVAALRSTAPDLAALRDVVVIDGEPVDGTQGWAEFISSGASVPDAVVHERIDALGPDDVCDIVFTSGTTGKPKGVVMRHGPTLETYESVNEGLDLREGDRILVVMPFFHNFGYKSGWLLALTVGATTIPMAVFEPGATLAAIEEHRITHLGGSPTIFGALIDHPRRPHTDFSSFRVALVSAAYVPMELINHMIDDLQVDYAMTGYGLTEAHGVVGITYPDDPREVVATWSGRGTIPRTEMRIVDEDGNDVPVGERGEVWFRGYNVSTGYLDEPEATAEVFDDQGWLHTGDIAFMNDEGYFKICDRKKEMYISGGFNVAPAEVEGVLTDWDRIAVAAVVAVPDDHLGEVGVAFVVPASDAGTLHADEVIAHAREVMANYKVPRRVEVVDELPLNATGKVIKDELRARL